MTQRTPWVRKAGDRRFNRYGCNLLQESGRILLFLGPWKVESWANIRGCRNVCCKASLVQPGSTVTKAFHPPMHPLPQMSPQKSPHSLTSGKLRTGRDTTNDIWSFLSTNSRLTDPAEGPAIENDRTSHGGSPAFLLAGPSLEPCIPFCQEQRGDFFSSDSSFGGEGDCEKEEK